MIDRTTERGYTALRHIAIELERIVGASYHDRYDKPYRDIERMLKTMRPTKRAYTLAKRACADIARALKGVVDCEEWEELYSTLTRWLYTAIESRKPIS